MARSRHYYFIGPLSVRMTRQQAARWNTAGITEHDLDNIAVTLPDKYAQATSIRNGALVMGGAKLVEHSRPISLREALDRADLAEMLDGCEAVLIPVRASSRWPRRGYQIHSSADNTGWEGEIFPTMAEANLAIKTWKSLVGGRHTYDVVRVDSAPTITFAQWNSEPIN